MLSDFSGILALLLVASSGLLAFGLVAFVRLDTFALVPLGSLLICFHEPALVSATSIENRYSNPTRDSAEASKFLQTGFHLEVSLIVC